MMQNSLVTPKDSAKIDVSLLLSKLSNLLVGLIIFFSATQFGLHFWPLSSLVYGIRVDYLAPTLYFLDCLILLYLGLQGLTLKDEPNRETYKARKVRPYWNLIMERTDLNGTMGALAPILLTNLLYSANPLSTLSWSLHFILYFAFVRSVLVALGSDLEGSAQPAVTKAGRSDPQSQFENWRIYDLKFLIPRVLTLSLFFQTCLAFTQVVLGRSVGGLLYYLGERNIAVGSPNIALATFMDSVVLRAYGTFSHPNILAGYAVISLLIILYLRGDSSQDRLPATKGSDPLRKTRPSGLFSRLNNTIRRPGQTLWVPIATILTTLLVILTQSRSAAISLFGLIIPLYLVKKTRFRTLFLYFIGLGIAISLFASGLSRQLDLSSSQRLTLQSLSLSVIKSYPIFGTGTQASISTYPLVDSSVRLLQPDHNSFTFFLSWFGLFGVLALFSAAKGSDLVSRSVLKRNSWLQAKKGSPASERTDLNGTLKFILPLLPILLLDHYLLTSPQGLFILLIYTRVAYLS